MNSCFWDFLTFQDDSSDSDTDTFDDDSQSLTSTIANNDRESNNITWLSEKTTKVWIFKEVISLRINLWSVAYFFHPN